MKLSDIIQNPFELIFSIGMHGGFNFLDDEQYIKFMYSCKFRRKLDLDNPRSLNEKIQWLKLHDHNIKYIELVDKYAVKQYVEKILGKDYIIPTIGVWDNFDEIDFGRLPQQFVLKCTHDSGGLVICKNKSNLNIEEARKKINSSLKRNYFWVGREWPYKNIRPRIIAEHYIEDSEASGGLTDYKLYCFNGKVKLFMVATDRYSKNKKRYDYFDENGQWIDMTWGVPNSDGKLMLTPHFNDLKNVAEKLSKGIKHVRVDLYFSNGRIYFGAMTFYDGSGFDVIKPYEWDAKLGDLIILDS